MRSQLDRHVVMGFIKKKSMRITMFLFFLLLPSFSWTVCMPGMLHAEEASINDVIVTNSTKELLVYFSVSDAFTPEMEKGIHSGIPVTFTFKVNLERPRNGWLDQKLVSLSFEHTLSYDNLKEEYHIECSEQGGKGSIVKSLAEAKALMAEVNGLKVAPLDQLVPETSYTLSVMTYLDKKTLPLNFHYLIPFWGLWDFKTDWYTVEFRY